LVGYISEYHTYVYFRLEKLPGYVFKNDNTQKTSFYEPWIGGFDVVESWSWVLKLPPID